MIINKKQMKTEHTEKSEAAWHGPGKKGTLELTTHQGKMAPVFYPCGRWWLCLIHSDGSSASQAAGIG